MCMLCQMCIRANGANGSNLDEACSCKFVIKGAMFSMLMEIAVCDGMCCGSCLHRKAQKRVDRVCQLST